MLTYEAMMDDQNHNNWEAAADNFRQPPPPPSSSIPDPGREPPGGQLLAVPSGSVDRKGPKEGLPMGPPPLPEPSGVIMMLKSCDAAAAVAKAAPAPTPSSTININTSTSKFRESGLFPIASAASPHQLAESPRPGRAPLPLFQASVSLFPLTLLPSLSVCSRCLADQPRLLFTCALCFRQGLYYA